MKIRYPTIRSAITATAPTKYFMNYLDYFFKKNYLQQSFPLLAFLNFLKATKATMPTKPKPTIISIILTLFYKVKLNPAEIVKSEVELFNPTEPIIV